MAAAAAVAAVVSVAEAVVLDEDEAMSEMKRQCSILQYLHKI